MVTDVEDRGEPRGGGWKDWVQAYRPLAQANLATPLIYGQALAYAATERFDATALLAVTAWGLIDQAVIVFGNDYADRDHDAGGAAKTAFSGGSGVIPEGKIAPAELLAAARGSFLALGVLSAAMAARFSWWALPLWLGAGLTLWLYSYGPRLSYRGGGEWLQAAGVGIILPLIGYSAQAGGLAELPATALFPSFLLAFAGNIATSLPDEDADRRAAKRTWTVRFGARGAALGCTLITAVAILLGAFVAPALRLTAPALLPLLGALTLAVAGAGLGRHPRILGFIVLQGAATQIYYLGAAGLLFAGR